MKIIMFRDPSIIFENIENLPTDEFILWAKSYNIFQTNGTTFYQKVCEKIKARLDREGLSYDTVRPE